MKYCVNFFQSTTLFLLFMFSGVSLCSFDIEGSPGSVDRPNIVLKSSLEAEILSVLQSKESDSDILEELNPENFKSQFNNFLINEGYSDDLSKKLGNEKARSNFMSQLKEFITSYISKELNKNDAKFVTVASEKGALEPLVFKNLDKKSVDYIFDIVMAIESEHPHFLNDPFSALSIKNKAKMIYLASKVKPYLKDRKSSLPIKSLWSLQDTFFPMLSFEKSGFLFSELMENTDQYFPFNKKQLFLRLYADMDNLEQLKKQGAITDREEKIVQLSKYFKENQIYDTYYAILDSIRLGTMTTLLGAIMILKAVEAKNAISF